MTDRAQDAGEPQSLGASAGDTWRSVARTVTEADIMAFAGVSGDFNQLHTDEHWTRANTPYRGRIAHGMLVASISTGLRTPGLDELTVTAFLAVERRMKAPVYPGDTVSVRYTVVSIEPSRSRPGSAVLQLDVDVVNHEGTVVQTGSDVYLIDVAGARA